MIKEMMAGAREAPARRLRQRHKRRGIVDLLAAGTMRVLAVAAALLTVVIVLGLYLKSRPILAAHSLTELIFSSTWQPFKKQFGFFPFIVGTLEVTLIAMVLAVPICLLSAIYLSEYAHPRLRETAKPVVDVLAGIPSVIYGLWGVLAIVPFVRALGMAIGRQTNGYSLLAAGIVLAVMVFPVIISVTTEVLRAVPRELREASLAVGATRWETIVKVVMPAARRGIIAGFVLGFSRAFGETMAVLMVAGNVPKVAASLFDPVYPLPALIANNYGEMMSIPLYDSALLLAALILMVVVAAFHVAAHMALVRLEQERQ